MFFAFGLLVSQSISDTIKHFVKQARPETCILLEMCDSHGWPSSHSNYMFFFATYFTLLTYKKYGIILRSQMWVVMGVVWPLAVLTMWSRVYLGYHTVGQVFAGAGLGIVLGVAWFRFVNGYVKDVWFLRIEESFIGRWLYIKDTSHIPNLLEFEYENARAARRHPSYKRSE